MAPGRIPGLGYAQAQHSRRLLNHSTLMGLIHYPWIGMLFIEILLDIKLTVECIDQTPSDE